MIATMLFLYSMNFACAANSFTYVLATNEHSGRFDGEVPIDRIGNLILPRGLALFSGDEVTIKAVPQWLFDRNVVLRGVIIRAEGASQSDGFVLGGLLLILDGMWSSNLAKVALEETVDTVDGASKHGKIVGRSGLDSLSFQAGGGKIENIEFNKIKTITSPRAFTFNISADSVKISPEDKSMGFTAKALVLHSRQGRHTFGLFAQNHVPRSTLPGTEAGISKAALATFLSLDFMSTIAPAVSIPLVLNARNQRAAKNKIAETEFQNFASSLQSSPTASSTASSSGSRTGM